MSLPGLHYRVDAAGSSLKSLLPDCFTRVHIQIFTCIPRVEPTYWELTWCRDVGVVISSCWRPLIHPYFIRFSINSDPLSNLNGPVLSETLSSPSSSYFWIPPLPQDSLLGSPEFLWVDHWEFSAAISDPFSLKPPSNCFHSCVLCVRLEPGILCLWIGSWAAWSPTTNPTPFTFPVPLNPSEGSSIINPPLDPTPKEVQTPLFAPACVSSPIPTANFI